MQTYGHTGGGFDDSTRDEDVHSVQASSCRAGFSQPWHSDKTKGTQYIQEVTFSLTITV